jgi:hypothetical protein
MNTCTYVSNSKLFDEASAVTKAFGFAGASKQTCCQQHKHLQELSKHMWPTRLQKCPHPNAKRFKNIALVDK